MTNIAEVIGWKFNHQTGMRCKEVNGVLKIVEFPGGIPSQADQDTWTTEYNARNIKAERITRITEGDDLQKVVFKMFFKLNNKVRALEGKQPLTVNQFLTFLEGELE